MGKSNENEIQTHDNGCPLVLENPGVCLVIDKINDNINDIGVIRNDVAWLKKGYFVQVLFAGGTFISMLGLILRITGVV